MNLTLRDLLEDAINDSKTNKRTTVNLEVDDVDDAVDKLIEMGCDIGSRFEEDDGSSVVTSRDGSWRLSIVQP